MRAFYRIFYLSLALGLATLHSLSAAPDKFSREEWFAMPESHRRQHLSMAISNLKYQEVPLARTLKEYLADVDALFNQTPDMDPTPLSVILPSLVYKNEPESHKILDDLIKKHEIEIVAL